MRLLHRAQGLRIPCGFLGCPPDAPRARVAWQSLVPRKVSENRFLLGDDVRKIPSRSADVSDVQMPDENGFLSCGMKIKA